MGVYQVCIPHTNKDYFDYESASLTPCIGSRVWVPFRNHIRLGIVISHPISPNPTHSLKCIKERIDEHPLITDEVLRLCWWISRYYQSPLSEVLPLAIPKKYRQGLACELPMEDFYQLKIPAEDAKQRIGSKAHKQLDLIAFFTTQEGPVPKQRVIQNGFTNRLIMALVAADVVEYSQQSILPHPTNAPLHAPLPLNEEQAHAVTAIRAQLHHYHSFLLHGVTGSGKTEVYLQIIAHVLEQGKQVLVLVPEIGLTPQLLARFTARFKHPIALMHSHLNESERRIAWQLAKENQVRLIIGTRSSVFTPLPHLGLIVIDEEHDSSLKQMEGVRYSARDTALMRAHFANIPIILGSATPSLESVYNCKQGKHTLLKLHHKALTATPLHYQLVDLRSQTLHHGLAMPTLNAIEDHLQRQNQVLIFINRRGFAPVVLCHRCGWMADCRACDSHLTLHKQLAQMICHHCGLTQQKPLLCPQCHSNELIPVGAGTQRIHEFLSTRFPQTPILRIDRDEVRKKHALTASLEQIHQGKAQLIVGTQMLAKGHHFPRVSLVVVLETDAGLYNQDFRALEHLGQLLIQVSGRAGRADLPGQALIQTHVPHHPLLNVLIQKGYDDFAHALLASRYQAELPPFQFLAVIRAQSHTIHKVLQFMHAAKEHMQSHPLIAVMGPAPAPLPRKANQHRMQLLIKSRSRKTLHHALTQLREWLTETKRSNSIRWNVDVDPMDLS